MCSDSLLVMTFWKVLPPSTSKIVQNWQTWPKLPEHALSRTQQMKVPMLTDGGDCMFRLSLGHDKALPASNSSHLDLRHSRPMNHFISLESSDSTETQIPLNYGWMIRSPGLPVPICQLWPYLVVASVRTPSRIAWTIVSTSLWSFLEGIYWP